MVQIIVYPELDEGEYSLTYQAFCPQLQHLGTVECGTPDGAARGLLYKIQQDTTTPNKLTAYIEEYDHVEIRADRQVD